MLSALLFLTCLGAHAVENDSTGTFNETAPTSSNIPNWESGWTQPTTQPTGYTYTTGWNYVGSVPNSGGASATYLGNGWVITCAHVGAATFTLNGTAYPAVPNSAQGFTATTVLSTMLGGSGTVTEPVDITLFQISPSPALPALPLRTTDPTGTSTFAMIGYGDGGSHAKETWGYDTVTSPYINQGVQLYGWASYDFCTVNGSKALYETADGDSGGADFIYNSSLKRWELAGLNEIELTNGANPPVEEGSGYVQLDTYFTQIEQIITPPLSEPTMPQWALVLMGGMLFCVAVPAVLLERR